MNESSLEKTIEGQFRQKAEHRRCLAGLSFEEKLKRLVKLQAIAYTIGRQVGRKPRKPWGVKRLSLTSV